MSVTLPFTLTATLSEVEEMQSQIVQDFLSRAEIEYYRSLRLPKVQKTWLVGRWLSKRLIIERTNFEGSPREIEIVSRNIDGKGIRPFLRFSSFNSSAQQDWSVSISHTDHLALAALSTEPDVTVGCDLTEIQPFHDNFVCQWFSVSERDSMKDLAPSTIATYWSIKEAVYKSINQGEGFSPRQFEVRSLGDKQFTCSYRGVDFGDRLKLQLSKFAKHVVAVSYIEENCYQAKEPITKRNQPSSQSKLSMQTY